MRKPTIDPIVIWGAGGHAKVVAEILRLEERWQVAGFLDDINPKRLGETFAGAVVLGSTEKLPELLQSGVVHIALGVGDCRARLGLLDSKLLEHFQLVTAIHRAAVVSADAILDAGTMVAAGAVINPGAKIGRAVIINSGAIIEHDCVIEDGAHIAPGACLAGGVHVGRGAMIGLGAAVRERVRIGAGALIGAGAAVVADIAADTVAYGVPAKPARRL